MPVKKFFDEYKGMLFFFLYMVVILCCYINLLPYADLVGDDGIWGNLAVSIARQGTKTFWGEGWYSIPHSSLISYLEALFFYIFGTLHSLYYLSIAALFVFHASLIVLGGKYGSSPSGYLASLFLLLNSVYSFFYGLSLWNPILIGPSIALCMICTLNFISPKRTPWWLLGMVVCLALAVHSHALCLFLAPLFFFFGFVTRDTPMSIGMRMLSLFGFFTLTLQFSIVSFNIGNWMYFALFVVTGLVFVLPVHKLHHVCSPRTIYSGCALTFVLLLSYHLFFHELSAIDRNNTITAAVSNYIMARHNFSSSLATFGNFKQFLTLQYLQLVWIVPFLFIKNLSKERALLLTITVGTTLVNLYVGTKGQLHLYYFLGSFPALLLGGGLIISEVQLTFRGLLSGTLIAVYTFVCLLFDIQLVDHLTSTGGDGAHCSSLGTKEFMLDFVRLNYPDASLFYYASSDQNTHDLNAWQLAKSIILPTPRQYDSKGHIVCLAVYEPHCSLKRLENVPVPQGRVVLSIGVNSLIEVPCRMPDLSAL